jgi:hypothetical protein
MRTLLVSAFIFFFSLTTWAQTANVPGRITQAVDIENLVTLRGNTHPLARPEYDQGAAPDSLPMERMLLVLQRSAEQEAALRKLLDEQQIKSSPNYHMWLTPEQFGQQFGPADADIQAVTDWLGSQGFQVSRVAAGRTVVEFSGTAGEVREAFHTEMHKFVVNGEEHWANASDPEIPAALAPVVAGFASLNNFPRQPMIHRVGAFSRSKATRKVQPLFTYLASCGSSGGTCYYFALGPTDFGTIYNVLPLWNANTDGTGQTIAVVGETNINPQDVAEFRAMFGLPVNPPNVILNGPDPGINGDELEADLDVQWSGAVAKGATIDLVVSETTETTPGIDLSALYIIDNNLAPVMSESYGVCEAELGAGGNQFHDTLWEQAAAQGITVLISAGDSGSAGCDSANRGETAAQYGLAVNGLASTPFNVAVGGTDINDVGEWSTYWNFTNNPTTQASAKSYIPESTWNYSCAASGSLTGCTPPPNSEYLDYGLYLVAGGGGPSSCINPTGTFPNVTCSGNYSKPSWQSGAGVPNDSARDIPDVSLLAAVYVVCQMDANASRGGNSSSCDLNAPYMDFQSAAGTSASVQVFGGIMALVNQRYGRQGNANYVLYPMAARSGASCNSSPAAVNDSSCTFYDVTVGNNSVICKGGSPNCSNTIPGQYGIMVSNGSPAYPTTTGYDLATGLGSVNAANLVNNWKSIFTLSTTALSLSTSPATNPIKLTHGQAVNFDITVAPGSGSGTPTGDVSLIAQTGNSASNVTGIGPFTLSGGSVSNSTNMLPGGSYNVAAHYAGNGTYAASDSSPGIPVTVGKESSQTEVRLVTLSATAPPAYNVTTVPYGSLYGLRMDVTNSSGHLCGSATTGLISYPCPTGALTVSPAPTDENPPPDTVPGSYTLNSQGYAEDQFMQQTPGTYNFVASYAGDNSYTASTSPTVPITITKAPTTPTVSAPSSTVTENFNLTAVVNTKSYGVAPTGTVQFLNGSTLVGGPMWVSGTSYSSSTGAFATARVVLNAVSLPPGTASITAQYSGDSNYAGSTSSPVAINVTDFSFSATAITLSNSVQSASSTLTITPLGGYTGTISLSSGNWPVGMFCWFPAWSVTINSSSPATATFTCTLTAPVSVTPPNPQRRPPPGFRLPVGLLWLLAGPLTLAMLLRLAAARRPAGLLFATALLVIGIWVACGGGSPGNPAPALAPQVTLSPTSLTFGQVNVGSSSTAQVTLSNTGNAPLSMGGVGINGTDAPDFTPGSNCGTSVGVGANCEVSVKFAPSGTGSRNALLEVFDNANDSPQTATLTGTGIPAATTVSLKPASLAFGQQEIGTTSAPQTVTLSNTGAAPLTISSIGMIGLGGDYTEANNCGNGLAVGANCTISVAFAPTYPGLASAAVVVTDNANFSPQGVALTGTGAIPPGNYTIEILASDMGSLDTHSLQIALTVQ